jgi:hypothetical protein
MPLVKVKLEKMTNQNDYTAKPNIKKIKPSISPKKESMPLKPKLPKKKKESFIRTKRTVKMTKPVKVSNKSKLEDHTGLPSNDQTKEKLNPSPKESF